MPRISKTLTSLLGGVVVSLMCASTAGASCADPSPLLRRTLLPPPGPAALAPRLAAGAQLGRGEDNGERQAGGVRDRIVGTWLVTYGGVIAGQAFIQWHSDGTEWENIDLPTLGGNICMGDWRVVDENHVSRSHVGWLFSNGNPAGYFTSIETDEVARDGSWYRGTNYIRMYDANGHQFFEGAGTAEATRIPQP
jgi:hypothetical protein